MPDVLMSNVPMPDERGPWRRHGLSISGGLVLGCLALLLLACGGGGGGGSTGGGGGGDFGIPARVPLAALNFPGQGPDPGAVSLELAFHPDIDFNDRSIYFTTAPDPRLAAAAPWWAVVAEQDGAIHIFPNNPSVRTTSSLLDLSSDAGGPVIRDGNEEGLLGLVFDPEFVNNGYFYVHYSAASPRRGVIARYTATFPSDPSLAPTASAATQLIILEVAQPDRNHNAGMLAFGSDGHLYVAMGDGGQSANGQDRSSLLGSMLRIDVRGATVAQPYRVPVDNPFVGQAGARTEAWATGFRNPWRFSFDRNTGELWLGDVGQTAREEIDFVVEGGNYGWRVYEGDRENINPGNLPASSFEAPVIDYGRGTGTVVVGGYVYRGLDVPTIQGAYVYGDYGSGRIWAIVPDGQGGMVSNTQIASLNGICSFGEDEHGELYAVSIGGRIYRFAESGPPPPAFPATLSETGLFTDLDSLSPTAGLIEYDVGAPLYSDDAIKRRFVGLPGNTTITFRVDEPWTFPTGAVLVKHFELELTVGDPGSRRRLETRVLLREIDGWAGYTYRWNDAQDEALLLADGLSETFTIQDALAPGGEREQTWTYPRRSDCLQCHTAAGGPVLGVRTEQLNRDRDYPSTMTDNQLRSWNHIGLFDVDIGSAALLPAWPDPEDVTETLEARARAYLAVNCAQCHQPGAPAPGSLDFRYATSNANLGAIGNSPMQGDLGRAAPKIIDPGDRDNSVLWLRMDALGATRMPRIGSDRVDQGGVDLIGAWIDSLGP